MPENATADSMRTVKTPWHPAGYTCCKMIDQATADGRTMFKPFVQLDAAERR